MLNLTVVSYVFFHVESDSGDRFGMQGLLGHEIWKFFGFVGRFGQIWRWAAALLGKPFKKRRQNILIFAEINYPWYKH